jgi:hypothetical protein
MLLHLAMSDMLSAKGAELLEFQPLAHGLLVLRRAVVAALALGALQSDDISWHNRLLITR